MVRSLLKLPPSAALLALALRASGAARAAEPPAPPAAPEAAPEAREHGTRLRLRVPLQAYYTSNLFHIQERRLAGFDSNLDPGQRFYGMTSIGDLVLRPGVRAVLDVPLGHKRDAKLGAGADYFLHVQNGIANYLRLHANGSIDLTRHDTIGVDAKLAPDRFKKNHREPVTGATYLHAYAREATLSAHYDHGFTHAVAARLEYLLDQTAYDAPFHNRDELLNEGRAAVVLDVGHKSHLEVGGGFGVSASPGEQERGIVVDRSFHEIVALAGARIATSPAATLDLAAEFRQRDFTTDVAADLVHYRRSDRLYRIRAGMHRKLSDSLSLGAFGGFALDLSNRADPNLTPDEAGYREFVLGAELAWRFSGSGGR